MSDSYPIYLLPEEFIKIRTDSDKPVDIDLKEIEGFNPPPLYKCLEFEKPPHLPKPNLYFSSTEDLRPRFYLIVGIIFIISLLLIDDISLYSFLTILAVAFIGYTGIDKIIIYPFLLIRFLFESYSYKKNIEENKELWRTFNHQQDAESEKFKKSLIKYNQYFNDFIEDIDVEVITELINLSIKMEKEEYFKHSSKPFKASENPTKGRWESQLRIYLSEIIKTGTFLTGYAIYTLTYNKKYYPDIIYRDDDGFYIDIEIDEPYVDNKNQSFIPTHYIWSRTNSHIDDDRNTSFLESNWFVIRFTERQVFEEPIGCVKSVYQLISYIKKNDMSTFSPISYVKEDQFWTANEAHRMYMNNYRKNYAKPDISKDIRNLILNG